MKEKLTLFLSKVEIYFKTNKLFIVFFLSSVINATLLRFLTVKNYFEIKPMLADIGAVLLIGAFGYFFKPKNQFKYYFGWAIFFTFLCVVNSMYYTNYMSYASVSLLATSLQVIDVADAITKNVMELKDFSYLWQIIAMIFVHIYLKKKDYYEYVKNIEVGKVRALNTIVASLIFFGFFVSTLTGLDISRLGKQWNRSYLVMNFGLYTYQANDIFVSLKTKISPLFGYDEAAKEFREFYSNKEESEPNEYTDILKGRNVIVIHAESIQDFAMNTEINGMEVTPNLNRLASEGLFFSNFYAQESVGTSSDSEFTFLTSLMPAINGTVAISYWDRLYNTSLKELKKLGYYNFSMHANNGTFWNRNIIHPRYGYDKFYYHSKDFEIDEVLGFGLSDKSFFRQSIDKIKDINDNNQNFYGTMIMLTNHTPFDAGQWIKFDVSSSYEKINEETGETEVVTVPFLEDRILGNYLKTVHYADEAIGEFINGLDEAGLLENTVVVIYGDHDAKLKKSEYLYYYNYDPITESLIDEDDPNYIDIDSYDYELNRKVPFIIWTKDKKIQGKIDKVMGMYDASPTLGNMLGFNNKYALGHDIFSIDNNIVVFPDGSWVTDIMYYSSAKGEGKPLNSEATISTDYIENNNDYAEKIIKISNDIIIYDLIKRISEEQAVVNDEIDIEDSDV